MKKVNNQEIRHENMHTEKMEFYGKAAEINQIQDKENVTGKEIMLDKEKNTENASFGRSAFISYEYKDINVREELASFYLDCYEHFGWQQDEHFASTVGGGKVHLKLKRNRKIVNKVELTRLQRHFEADMEEIFALENSKTRFAEMLSISIGVVGTAFMAGSVFAVTANPPIIWLCALLGIPAFAGWILPYFVYQKIKTQKTQQVTPFIEAKYDEIYEICEKGHALL